MDTFELNKIAGAILFTCLVVLGLQNLAGIIYHAEKPEQPGYKVEIAEDTGAAGETEATEERVPLAVLLASADVEKGERVAKKCSACHTFNEGGKNGTGPNLYGVVGRTAGTVDGFSYSDVMAGWNKPWTFAELDGFINAPKDWMPGTKMAYKGISKETDRAHLLVYLRSLSASPVDLPKPEEAAATTEGESTEASGESTGQSGEASQSSGETMQEKTDEATDAMKDAAGEATEKADDAMKDAAGEATDKADGAAKDAAGDAAEKADEAADKASEAADKAQEAADEAKDAAEDAKNAAEKAGDAANGASETMNDAAGQAGDAANSATETMKDAAGEATENAGDAATGTTSTQPPVPTAE